MYYFFFRWSDFPENNKTKLGSITTLRGIAAGLILILHMALRTSRLGYDSGMFEQVGKFGTIGIDIFFVISGFIIMYIGYDHFNEQNFARIFFVKRLARIFPTLWFVTALLIPVYLSHPAVINSSKGPPNLALSFLLLPDQNPFLLYPAWTLVHELMFYTIMFFALAFPRDHGLRIIFLTIGSFVFLGYTNFLGQGLCLPNPVIQRVASELNGEFLLGILIYFAFRRNSMPLAATSLTAGTLLAFASSFCFLDSQTTLPRLLYLGIPSALFVYGMVGIEKNKPSLKFPRIMLFLGTISYSLYLIHVPILGLIIVLWRAFGLKEVVPVWGLLMAWTLVVIAASTLLFLLIEQPSLKLLRRRIV